MSPGDKESTVSNDSVKDELVAESTRPGWVLLLILTVAVSILFLPSPTGMPVTAHRLLAVAALMGGLWMTQAIPLAATSLLPLALFPLLGIQSAKETSKAFMEDNLFLYIGGMLIALGIERWHLHRRMALAIVSAAGVSPKRLVLGFGAATFAMSMWISNTAATMLMLPIGLALLRILEEGQSQNSPECRRLGFSLLLSIAYGASLGGMATLVGSPTNSQAIGIYQIYRKSFPNAADVYFSEWLLSCTPIALIYMLCVWLVLTWNLPGNREQDRALRDMLVRQRKKLGPLSGPERRMALVFVSTAVLWVTRQQIVIGGKPVFPGWLPFFESLSARLSEFSGGAGKAVPAEGMISDATVGIAMATLLFFLPSGQKDKYGRSVPLMDWKTANRLPWGMILLFGGGFALASGFESTQLAAWCGEAMRQPLQSMAPWQIVAVVCFVLIMTTELTSNVATVSAVLPALLAMAAPLNMDPRMLFVPATLATSACFMLPVGTPPNAIVFSTGRIPSLQMALYGLLLNIIGVCILTAGTWIFIRPVMGIE